MLGLSFAGNMFKKPFRSPFFDIGQIFDTAIKTIQKTPHSQMSYANEVPKVLTISGTFVAVQLAVIIAALNTTVACSTAR